MSNHRQEKVYDSFAGLPAADGDEIDRPYAHLPAGRAEMSYGGSDSPRVRMALSLLWLLGMTPTRLV